MKNYNSYNDLISDVGTSRKVTAHRNVRAAVENKTIQPIRTPSIMDIVTYNTPIIARQEQHSVL
jgi:hypothetical protein